MSKYGPEKTPYLDTSHSVTFSTNSLVFTSVLKFCVLVYQFICVILHCSTFTNFTFSMRIQVQHLVTSIHVKLVFKKSNSPYKLHVLYLISVSDALCEAASFHFPYFKSSIFYSLHEYYVWIYFI